MGALGSKTTLPDSAIQSLKEASKKARGKQIRFRGSRYASAEQVKAALVGSVGDYLAIMDKLARTSEDDRIRVDSAKYLIDRVAGKPTEKVQHETAPVTVIQPTQEQLTEMAEGVLMPNVPKEKAPNDPGNPNVGVNVSTPDRTGH